MGQMTENMNKIRNSDHTGIQLLQLNFPTEPFCAAKSSPLWHLKSERIVIVIIINPTAPDCLKANTKDLNR